MFRIARAALVNWRLAHSHQSLLGTVSQKGSRAFFRRTVRTCMKTWRTRARVQRTLRRFVRASAADTARAHFLHWAAVWARRRVLVRQRQRADRLARAATLTHAVASWRWAWRAHVSAAVFRRRWTLKSMCVNFHMLTCVCAMALSWVWVPVYQAFSTRPSTLAADVCSWSSS